MSPVVASAAAPQHPAGRSRLRDLAGRAGVAGLVAGLVAAQALVLTGAVGGSPAEAARRQADSDVTIVQANLRSPQHWRTFQQDRDKVMAQDPDLITYNEVAFRHESQLAPKGWELWQPVGCFDTRCPGHEPRRYQVATRVAWRSDTWSAVAQGTTRITNYRKVPNGRTTRIGWRFANWVSLESQDGRKLSVVSIHISPRFTDEGRDFDMVPPSVRRLGDLVERLSSHGPVLVGGDFNVPHRGKRYPRQLLDRAKLKSTYDLLGTSFPTQGRRATIDYVFLRGAGQLQADWHKPLELNSDHDAVVAGLSWTTQAPGAPEAEPVVTAVRNRPSGTQAQRLSVSRVVRRHIARVPAGATLELATRGLSLRPAYRALRRAAVRGVQVHVTTRSPRLTWWERRLRQALRSAEGSRLQHCRGACVERWGADKAPSVLLVTGGDGEAKVRIDVSRRLRHSVITRRTRAWIMTGDEALEEAAAAFDRL